MTDTLDDLESQAPPFPQDHRQEFVVWADVDAFGMPRDAFVHEQTYLKTRSTGTLHAVTRYGSCVKPDRMVEVGVPLVSDTPDTATRCSRCIGCRRTDDDPPRAMTNAVALVGRLKWLTDFVTALEARVGTLDRASVLAFRRRGPLSARVDDDVELDPRVRQAGRAALAALEDRHREALERMGRRLAHERSDVEEHLDRLVVRLAVREAWEELAEEARTRLWPLIRCVDSRCQAEHVWRSASEAWAEAIAGDLAVRVPSVDEAMTAFLEPPVVAVGTLREGECLTRNDRDHETPAAWLDAEFRARRTSLAEHWVRTLDDRLAEARRLREEEPDHWLLTSEWDELGPTRWDEDHAVLAAFPYTTAEVDNARSGSNRAGTSALVKAPAVLVCWLAGNEWATSDMGVAEGPLDGSTLHRLVDRMRGGEGDDG